jgi:phage FluMu protein Com
VKANAIIIVSMLLCATGAWASSQPAKKVDSKTAHAILETKCTKCHSVKVIDAALGAHKDMTRIQKTMEGKGASLSASEREVLGIFWKQQNPLQSNK